MWLDQLDPVTGGSIPSADSNTVRCGRARFASGGRVKFRRGGETNCVLNQFTKRENQHNDHRQHIAAIDPVTHVPLLFPLQNYLEIRNTKMANVIEIETRRLKNDIPKY